MKRTLIRIVLVLTLVLGFSASTPAFAEHVFNIGQTNAGITFVANPNAKKKAGTGGDNGAETGRAAAIADQQIPTADKATVTRTPAKASPGVLVKMAAADVIAGRLPQTNEAQALLVTLLGLLLLIVMALLALIYRQARLLKERE
ncbi:MULTISPECIES: LPXTG cell wall anchor domain-containing protein [Levilactobacillus]|uniref:LPXTG cell wall anchor domain-containing protein n=1 Tax=Levilactobacillus TaxID=2767886 RepID=UPI00194DD365|nr:LPXTG cell wall anchor domain-containing protein [Levilactobacillus sp. 244-2]